MSILLEPASLSPTLSMKVVIILLPGFRDKIKRTNMVTGPTELVMLDSSLTSLLRRLTWWIFDIWIKRDGANTRVALGII